PPGRAPGGARGRRRRLALDDPAARLDVAPGRHRQPAHDPGRHRPADRDAPAPRGGPAVRPLGVAVVAAGAVVVAGCGNFFPNPDNVVLPSAARTYDLVCGTVARGECEARAHKRVAQQRPQKPRSRIVTVRLDADGGYTIEFADGSSESMIVD